MIQILQKPFKIVLWETEERNSSSAALRLDFDTLDEARAEFDAQRRSGPYRTGILIEWHRGIGQSELLDSFP